MRKTLAVLALTASLTGGSAALASAASAEQDLLAAQPLATSQVEDAVSDDGESDKTGLWGLLGLLGLAGLAKKKERVEHSGTGTTHR